MRELRYNTATTVVVGPLIDISDGIATVDAATVADIDCGLVKQGTAGASITLTASGGDNDMTPVANNPGHYSLELTAGNVDTVGRLRITFNDPDVFLPLWEDFEVLAQAEYDRKYGTGAHSVEEIYGLVDDLETRLTAARAGYLDNLNGHTPQTGDSFARLGAPAGVSIAADLVAIEALVDDLESRLTAARASYLDNLNGHTPQTGDSFARLGAPAGVSVSADIAAINAYVDELESRLTAARAGYLDELAAGNIPTDLAAISVYVDELETRLTAARAGYLDNLNGHTPQTGDSFARLGAPAGVSIAADIAAVQAKADLLPEGPAKNTAYNNIEFLMVDSADHVTPKTGLTVSGQRSIDGGAFAAVTGAIAEVGSGIYQFDAAAADMNGDEITLLFTAAGADNCYLTIRTTS